MTTQAEAERIIAADLLRESRRQTELDAALDQVAAFLRANPEATHDDVWAALGPMLEAATKAYIARLYGVLAEDLPAAVAALS